MTRRSAFPEPKNILVFNGQRVLVAMYKSLNVASQMMNIPAQSISLCCLGHHISCNGYYFRHLDETKVEIVPNQDFGTFTLVEYDKMCDQVRRYHHPKEMNRRRISAVKRQKIKMKDE